MCRYWIWLSQLKNVSDSQKRSLLAYFSDAKTIYSASEESLADACELSREAMDALMDKSLANAEKIVTDCENLGLKILTMGDEEYPDRLQNIYDPPFVLYYKGILPDFNSLPAIGIVGTRHPSAYGLEAAYRMGYEVAACGGIVVSGLAMGVDAAAMSGAVAAGKTTVGVLGCGADVIYPKKNTALFEEVSRCGCILSEYLPGTPAANWNFPRRNRIISGLSNGILVVEAPEKSGSLITAQCAADQGRDVFAIPGNINMPGFIGSNRLLRSGAIAASTGWDVISEYEALYPGKLFQRVIPANLPTYTPMESAPVKQSNPVSKGAASKEKTVPSPKKAIDKADNGTYIDRDSLSGLSPDEQTVVAALGEEERLVDDVIARAGLSAGKVLSVLTMLEVKGVVQRHPGRRVSLKHRLQ